MSKLTRDRGLFITFEGVDGSGKSLISNLLADYLVKHNYKVLLTHEPGGSSLSGSIRSVLLQSRRGAIFKEAETLLFIADRAQHCREIILPLLNRNRIIVCDRYTDSTLAYQGGGRGLDIKTLDEINAFATGGLVPDFTFYLKVPLEVSQKRRENTEKDRMEQEDIDFFHRVEKVYDDLAVKNPERIYVIDGTMAPEEIVNNVLGLLEKCLDKLKQED